MQQNLDGNIQTQLGKPHLRVKWSIISQSGVWSVECESSCRGRGGFYTVWLTVRLTNIYTQYMVKFVMHLYSVSYESSSTCEAVCKTCYKHDTVVTISHSQCRTQDVCVVQRRLSMRVIDRNSSTYQTKTKLNTEYNRTQPTDVAFTNYEYFTGYFEYLAALTLPYARVQMPRCILL